MKNKISAVPYAVIAPLGVLLTAACCVLLVTLPGMLYGQYFGVMYTAAFFVMGRMPLHVLILCGISLPLLLSGILCAVFRKRKAAPWVVFAVCTVVFVVLFFVGMVVDTFSPHVARMFGTSPEMIHYYVAMDRQGMIGQSIAALVIYLFSHLCMLPKTRTPAKLVPFFIFFVLTLVLTPVYMLVFAHFLVMPMQVMFSAALAALTAFLLAGLVLLLMGIFMRIKPQAAPEAAEMPAPVPSVPVEPAPVAEEKPAPQETAVPSEPGLIFYAKKMNWSAHAPGAWENTVWKIYRSGAVSIATRYAGGGEPAVYAQRLTPDGGRKIAELLQSFTFCDAHRNGSDGAGWEMFGYTAQGDLAHRISGYIYGVPGLEAIAEFLENDIWNYTVKTEGTEA